MALPATYRPTVTSLRSTHVDSFTGTTSSFFSRSLGKSIRRRASYDRKMYASVTKMPSRLSTPRTMPAVAMG